MGGGLKSRELGNKRGEEKLRDGRSGSLVGKGPNVRGHSHSQLPDVHTPTVLWLDILGNLGCVDH